LLDDDDDDGGGIIRRNVVQLPKTFQLPDINMKHVVVRPQDDEQEELDYSIHDDVELEYMTTRVFLRHQLLTEWTSPSKTKDKDKDEDEDEDEDEDDDEDEGEDRDGDGNGDGYGGADGFADEDADRIQYITDDTIHEAADKRQQITEDS